MPPSEARVVQLNYIVVVCWCCSVAKERIIFSIVRMILFEYDSVPLLERVHQSIDWRIRTT